MSRTFDNQSNPPQEAGTPMLFWLAMIAIGTLGGVLYFLNDKLGAAAMIPLALGACLGYRSGAWKMFSMLMGYVCGFYLAAPTSEHLIPLVERTIQRPISNSGLGLGLSGFVAGTVATVLLMIVGGLVIRRNHGLKSLDQNLGMIAGATKSFALVAVGLWTILALEPRMIKMRSANFRVGEADSGSLYHRFLSVADATRKSPCLSPLTVWNPIATHPMLNSLLDKTESMVLDFKSQHNSAQSERIPAGSKLTGFLDGQH